MMRLVPWVLLILVILVLGWLAWDSGRKQKADEVKIALLEATRDQALSAAGKAQAYADSAAAVADSLDALRSRERAEAEARAQNLTKRADSLSAAIQGLVPAGEAQEQVAALLAQMRTSYEERIGDLQIAIDRSDAVIASLQNERVELRRSVGNLTEALEVTTEQRDICLDAKDPGLWSRVKSAGAYLGTGLGLGMLAGLILG